MYNHVDESIQIIMKNGFTRWQDVERFELIHLLNDYKDFSDEEQANGDTDECF